MTTPITYERGKLYQVSDYPWSDFTLYTVHGVSDPNLDNGVPYRRVIMARPTKGAIFLYLGHLSPGGTLTIPLHRVICGDVEGAVDARIVFEPLEEPSDEQ